MDSKNFDQDLLQRWRVAELLARRAGENVEKWFRTGFEVDYKADGSPVTEADRHTEQLIRSLLDEWYPNDSIVGEEFGNREGTTGYTWYLDPIDGTKSFVAGVPLFTVLIGITNDTGEPVAGVILNPMTHETVSAAVGRGAWYNGKRTFLREARPIEESTVLMCDPTHMRACQPALAEHLFTKSGMIRTWADAYAYLMLASGRADLAVDPVMWPWDIAPLGPIITEAGGKFCTIDDGSSRLSDNCMAGRAGLVKAVQEAV